MIAEKKTLKQAVSTTPPKDSTFLEDLTFLKDDCPEHAHYDQRKALSRVGSEILATGSDAKQRKRSDKVCQCSNFLVIQSEQDENGNKKNKVKQTFSCDNYRICPICQYRRSKKWQKRSFEGYKEMSEKNPNLEYIMLTLTIKNCDIIDLRKNVNFLLKAFKKLADRMTKNGTILGFFRNFEVTREKEKCDLCNHDYTKSKTCSNKNNHTYTNFCHPHIHVMFAVKPGYFAGKNYISKEEWANEWKKALQVDYLPIVWVSKVKNIKKNPELDDENFKKLTEKEQSFASAICEIVKYTTKIDKEIFGKNIRDKKKKQENDEWVREYEKQLFGTRAIGTGGCFRIFSKENKKKKTGEEEKKSRKVRFYGYRQELLSYVSRRL